MSAAAAARVAAIDCGTNSLRLLVADVDPVAGQLSELDRRMEIVRLGQGVDATGRLAAAALDRTLRALARYAAIIEDLSVTAVRMVATSATRDAANSGDFVRGVTGVLGQPPEVLTGQEEAQLSFTGATAELAGWAVGPESGQLARAGPPYLVVDIGGGSTEFVLGAGPAVGVLPAAGPAAGGVRLAAGPAAAGGVGLAAGGAAASPAAAGGVGLGGGPVASPEPVPGGGISALSVDIGCVRMTERHLRSDPPSSAQIAAAAADIDAALDSVAAAVPVQEARTLVGLAGSVTTVAGLALGLAAYDPARIHHSRISARDVSLQAARLLRQTRAERARLGVMHPGRVDVIGGGAMILDHLMQRFGFTEVLVSEHDILDGIAWSLAAGPGR